MQDFLIVGVDVSKLSLDIFIKPTGKPLQIKNNLTGFKELRAQLKAVIATETRVMVIMEHTGHYSYRLEKFLRSKGINFCKIPALQIKRSLGVTRGKNDRIDAERIADYAWLRRDILVADVAILEEIRQLKTLLSLRQKLVRDRAGYIGRLKEAKATGFCKVLSVEAQVQKKTIAFLSIQVAQLENEIKVLIQSNQSIKATFDLLMSIKGVGLIIAAYMISSTANFTRFKNARKFNCYAGLAPFKNESGTSIKGRSRVSHLANKDSKALLNLAASSAIQWDPELKAYYQKRVAEGKRKMSCLNIIRAKIVARMFAVVKRQSPFKVLEMVA